MNYWLTGEMTAEFTNATTTQFIDARTRSWATDLLQALDVPTRILPQVVEPGTIVGSIGADAHPSLHGTRVVAPAPRYWLGGGRRSAPAATARF